MPVRDIYFLFNDADGSYNHHGLKPHPAFMKKGEVSERMLSVDLSLFEDITMVFYDEVTGDLVDGSAMMTRLNSSERGQAELEKMLIDVAADPNNVADASPEKIARRNHLIQLAREFMPAKAVNRILADGRIGATETAQIKAAIQAAKGA